MDENKDCLDLKEEIRKLKKDNERKSKRLDKIIKQSDKQQLLFISLNEQMTKQKEELDKLHEYDTEQQIVAKAKLDNTIINDLEDNEYFKSSIIYQPADILSGDFYSLHVLKNDNIFVVENRKEAIKRAIDEADKKDTIVILGKGDEEYHEIKGEFFPFDDREVVKEVIN